MSILQDKNKNQNGSLKESASLPRRLWMEKKINMDFFKKNQSMVQKINPQKRKKKKLKQKSIVESTDTSIDWFLS